MSILSRPYFHDEASAYAFLEGIVWPDGPICPHCGSIDHAYRIKANTAKRVRHGLLKCAYCRQQFTVKVNTVFEHCRIPLNKCLQAAYLMAASKKGVSANQLSRTLEITVKSAWFLAHRIREAMRSGDFTPFGDGGGAVEIDETFIGRDVTPRGKPRPKKRGYEHKMKVLSLVDRETGRAKSIVMDALSVATVSPILRENIAQEARVMTDESGLYRHLQKHFAEHGVVRHKADEYVSRSDASVHTNTIEGFFSIFKRGMKGVYQHCSKEHLHRYLAEFDFRYTNRIALEVDDAMRAERMLKGIRYKRLTYQTTGRGGQG
jgi:transposase-like protein